MYVRVYSRPQIKVGGKKESHILTAVYGLDKPGLEFRLGQGIFLLRIFHTGAGALPASCLMGTRVLSWS